MISYAQNREDVLLARVLRDTESGFYVDVGAHDPSNCSITRHFYDSGWRGINIEPGLIFERLVRHRPRDININAAASDCDGAVTFYEHPADPGTATLLDKLAPRLEHCAAGRYTRNVPARTLRSVFEEHRPERIDFLSIDVEGHERAVIAGNDWQRFRPRVLVIEAVSPYTNSLCHQNWEPLLLEAGYLYAMFDGINRFYVREEERMLLERFGCPVNVLDDYIPAEMHRLQEQLLAERARLPANLRAALLDAPTGLAKLARDTDIRALRWGLSLARGLHQLMRLCGALAPLKRLRAWNRGGCDGGNGTCSR